MVLACWNEIPEMFPTVGLDQVVLMPNHLHGIVILGYQHDPNQAAPTLGRVVQAFKSISTHRYIVGVKTRRWPRFEGHLWQRGYFDHIVRNDQALERHRDYLAGNPARWLMKRPQ